MKNIKQDNREIKIGNAIIWFCIGGIVTVLFLSL